METDLEFGQIDSSNRHIINKFIMNHWYSTDMVIRGQIIDMTQVNGIVVYSASKIVGLVTYTISNDICEITSLDSIMKNKGIGTELVNRVIEIARQTLCQKVILVTTNDNINVIRFYQKRGFDMARLYHNAIDISRKLKPSIPETGDNDIPLKHEIEFEYIL